MMYLYILKTINHNNKLYVGMTGNLSQRLCYHNTGRCKYTAKFMPWRIAYTEQFMDKRSALSRERQIKKWTRAKKEALIAGNLITLKVLARSRGF